MPFPWATSVQYPFGGLGTPKRSQALNTPDGDTSSSLAIAAADFLQTNSWSSSLVNVVPLSAMRAVYHFSHRRNRVTVLLLCVVPLGRESLLSQAAKRSSANRSRQKTLAL